MAKKPTHCWLEEFKHCGCSNLVLKRSDAIGYCPKHGTDRRRIAKLPYKGEELGCAHIG